MVRVSSRRWLMLPLETKTRELHGKMLLGLVAAERGWGVLIGSKSALRSVQAYLPRGMFFEKGVTPSMTAGLELSRSRGHRTSALCEEGLLYFGTNEYLHTPSVDYLDYLFTWGSRQAADVRAVVDRNQEKVVVSGNPRLDLVRPEWRGVFERAAGRIRERYGSIILVNTKFPTVNHVVRSIGDYTDYLKSYGKVRSKEQEAVWRRYVAFQGTVFPFMLELLPALSREFTKHTILVRPHPSENNTPWIEKARGLPNVEVVDQGNVLEWIMASDVVVHSNCVTGVEASLLGTPTVAYRPYQDEGVEFELPRAVGLEASTEAEMILMLQEVVRGDAGLREKALRRPAVIGQYIANADGRLASEVIADTISGLDLPVAEATFPIRPKGAAGAIARLKSLSPVKSVLTYNRKKFPRLVLAEVERLHAEFRGVSGLFADIQITQATDDGFCLYKP